MSALIPDGYFVDNHVVWGDLGRGGILSRGYRIQFPDNSSSDDDAFIDLENNIRKMLASCQRDERLQLQFYTSSDYQRAIARYAEETKKGKTPRTAAIREELIRRYRARMEEETLLRTECRLYLSTKLARLTTETGKRVRGFEYLFQVVERSFAQRAQFFQLLLESSGGSVDPLNDLGHLRDRGPGDRSSPGPQVVSAVHVAR